MRRSLLAVPTALLLVLTACGGDEPATGAGEATAGPSGAASPSASAGPTGGAPTATTAASPGGASSSRGPATGGGTPGGAGSSAGPATSGGATPAAPRRTSAPLPSSAGEADTTKATAPGSYTFDNSGTVTFAGSSQPVDGTTILTVDPVVSGSQHSVTESEQNRTEQDLLLRDGGSYISRLQITNAAFDKAVEPDPAALLVPDPADVGDRWSWTATSTDGKTTVRQSSTVLRTETLTIGGTRVATRVIETQLVVSGDADYRATITTWYAPAYHLPVKDRVKGSGTAQGFAFATDITSTARSVRPS